VRLIYIILLTTTKSSRCPQKNNGKLPSPDHYSQGLILTKTALEEIDQLSVKQNISLVSCHIQTLLEDTFYNMKKVRVLDLSSNNISNLPRNSFYGCVQLETLSLSNNQIERLIQSQFAPLNNLRLIDLSSNLLTSVDKNTFINLGPSLETINLEDNQLHTMSEVSLLPLTGLQVILLAANPWTCDCHLRGMRSLVVPHKLSTTNLTCSKPGAVAGATWDSLQDYHFACQPRVVVRETRISCVLGQSVNIICDVSGDPAPAVRWVQDGVILSEGLHYTITQSARPEPGVGMVITSTLVMRNISMAMGGQYLCVGINYAGVDREGVILSVKEKSLTLPSWEFFFLLLVSVIILLSTCLYISIRSLYRRYRVPGISGKQGELVFHYADICRQPQPGNQNMYENHKTSPKGADIRWEPVYDGTGPRTSALGYPAKHHSSAIAVKPSVSPVSEISEETLSEYFEPFLSTTGQHPHKSNHAPHNSTHAQHPLHSTHNPHNSTLAQHPLHSTHTPSNPTLAQHPPTYPSAPELARTQLKKVPPPTLPKPTRNGSTYNGVAVEGLEGSEV